MKITHGLILLVLFPGLNFAQSSPPASCPSGCGKTQEAETLGYRVPKPRNTKVHSPSGEWTLELKRSFGKAKLFITTQPGKEGAWKITIPRPIWMPLINDRGTIGWVEYINSGRQFQMFTCKPGEEPRCIRTVERVWNQLMWCFQPAPGAVPIVMGAFSVPGTNEFAYSMREAEADNLAQVIRIVEPESGETRVAWREAKRGTPGFPNPGGTRWVGFWPASSFLLGFGSRWGFPDGPRRVVMGTDLGKNPAVSTPEIWGGETSGAVTITFHPKEKEVRLVSEDGKTVHWRLQVLTKAQEAPEDHRPVWSLRLLEPAAAPKTEKAEHP